MARDAPDPNLEPSIIRARLRAELRSARARAGLTQRQVADELGWSPSKLLRIENGQVGISKTDLRALLTLYGVTDPSQTTAFIKLALESRRQPWSTYRDVLNPEYLVYLGYESSATRLWQYEPLLIPGILQTEAYARAVIWTFAPPGTPTEVKERQLRARLERQHHLNIEHPPAMSFVLDEAVVRRRVGSDHNNAVMREQLDRLRDLHERGSAVIQIVPFQAGMYQALRGPFVILGFADPDDGEVLYIENSRQSLITRDDAAQIDQYRNIFGDLQHRASDPAALTEVLDEILANQAA